MSKEMRRLVVVGGGAMGEAIISGLLQAGTMLAGQIAVTDANLERRQYLQEKYEIDASDNNADYLQSVESVVLAVKPAVVPEVLAEIGPSLKTTQTLISVAAGVSISSIEKNLAAEIPVVRVMPNTPALIGAGASAYSLGSYAGTRDSTRTKTIFTAIGRAWQVEEAQLNAVTGLSGSGPAYMFLILEALAEAGVRMGLPRELSQELATQTMFGAAKLALDTKQHPTLLKDQVITPGGTTAEGVYALEEGAIRTALGNAVRKATEKASKMDKGGRE